MGCFEGYHRTAAHLAAGPRSGWDGNEWSQAGPVSFLIKLRKIEAGPFNEERDGFPNVQRAPAADRYHTVTIMFTKERRPFTHIVLDRIRMYPAIEEPISALRRLAQCLGYSSKRVRRQHTRI